MFNSLKRTGSNDQTDASSLYSLLLSTNFIILLFSIRFIVEKGFFDSPVRGFALKLALVLIFVGCYFFCRYYFIKTRYSFEVVKLFNTKCAGRIRPTIIGVVYTIGTPASFIGFALLIAR